MSKHKSEMGVGLDEVIRRGARRVIEQTIDAELAELLERFGNVRTLQGQRAVVRNGYLPAREVLTAAHPHHQRHRIHVRDRAPPHHTHGQLRVTSHLPRAGFQTDQGSREILAPHQRCRQDRTVVEGHRLQRR